MHNQQNRKQYDISRAAEVMNSSYESENSFYDSEESHEKISVRNSIAPQNQVDSMLPLKQPQNLKLALNRNRYGKIEDDSRMGRDLEMDPTNRNSPTSPTKTPANAVLNKSNNHLFDNICIFCSKIFTYCCFSSTYPFVTSE